jgi:hypothetical protein
MGEGQFGREPERAATDLRRPRMRRQRESSREPVPWLWLGLGVLVTGGAVLAAIGLAALLLSREPLATSLPTPTVLRLTAPPSPIPTETAPLPSATPMPTFTPPPTPDLSRPPDEVTTGYYAVVANTANIGVSLRAGPSTDNIRLELVPEGTLLLVIDGPQEGSGFVWWQVRLGGGAEGWIAGDFLLPAAAPDEGPES